MTKSSRTELSTLNFTGDRHCFAENKKKWCYLLAQNYNKILKLEWTFPGIYTKSLLFHCCLDFSQKLFEVLTGGEMHVYCPPSGTFMHKHVHEWATAIY